MVASNKLSQSLSINSEQLHYELIRSKKRKYSIAMKIRRDGVLQINVPFATSNADIESFIRSKYHWIQKIRNKHAKQPTPRQANYEYGEHHYFLGKSYPLQLITAAKSKIELTNDSFLVFHRKNSNIQNMLFAWYRQQAKNYFEVRTHQLQQQFNFPKIRQIKLRKMKARFGSCSSDAVITYNIHLIKAAPDLIDYVIIHELCHLIHHNHGKGFYQLQSRCNPQWRAHKTRLNEQNLIYTF